MKSFKSIPCILLSGVLAIMLLSGGFIASAAAQADTSYIFNFDANLDDNDNGEWDSTTSSTGRDWVWGASITRLLATPGQALTGAPAGIIAAWDFPVSGSDVADNKGTTADYENRNENADATFEFWLKADDNTTDQVIWETGGGGDGSSLTIFNGNYRFTIKDGTDNLVKEFAIPDTTSYHQVTAVYERDYDGTNDRLTFYLDGVAQGSPDVSTVVHDWSGSDDAGLGGYQGTVGGTGADGDTLGTSTLDGQIAIYRFYETTAFSAAQVLNNYSAVTASVVNLSSSGDWGTAGNWDTGIVPTWAQEASIAGGLTGTVTQNGTGIKAITLGGTGDGSLEITGGSLTVYGDIADGGATSTLTLDGGTLDLQGNGLGTGGGPIDNLNLLSGTLQNVGSINGTGGLTKTGAGKLWLDGVNTYSGGTLIEAGAVIAASTNALPGFTSGGSIVVSNGATVAVRTGGAGEWTTGEFDTMVSNATLANGAGIGLEVLSPNAVTYGTDITGNIGFAKYGDGYLKLTGTNTYTGGTTLDGGTLELGNDLALGSGTLQLGGKLFYTGTSAHTNGDALVFINDSTLGDSVNNGALVFTGDVDFGGASRNLAIEADVTLQGTGTNGGLYQKTGAATLRVTGDADWTLGGAGSAIEVRDGAFIIDGGAITNFDAIRIMGDQPNGTAYFAITNGGSLTILNASSNLRLGYSPGSDATATNIADIAGRLSLATGGSGGLIGIGTASAVGIVNLLNGGLIEVDAISHNANTSIVNLNGGTLRALQNEVAFLEGLTQVNVLGGGAVFDSGGFTITVNQDLLDGGGGGGLTKDGLGTLILNGSNTFTGALAINAGTLLINSTNAMGTSGGKILVPYGGGFGPTYAIDQDFLGLVDQASEGTIVLGADSGNDLDFATAGMTNAGLGAAAGTWTYTGTLTPYGSTYRLGGGDGTLVYTNKLTGARNLLVGGGGTGGTVVLTEDADFTGGTTVTMGTLQLGNNGAAGSVQGDLVNNGSVRIFRSDDVTVANYISGTGSLYVIGGNAVTLNPTNTFSGGGEIGDANANGRPMLRLNADSQGAPGAITAGPLGTGTFTIRGPIITSDGAADREVMNDFLMRDGSGNALVIGDVSNYTGAITFSGAGDFDANRGIVVNSTGIFSGVLSGAGAIFKRGDGLMIVSGSNTLAGFSLEEGVLQITDDVNLGDPAALLDLNGGTLRIAAGYTNETRNFKLNNDTAGAIEVVDGETVLLGGLLGAGNTNLDGNQNTLFSKLGGGTMILTNVSVYPAQTAVRSGTLIYEDDGGHTENAGSASRYVIGLQEGDSATLIVRGNAVMDLDNSSNSYDFQLGAGVASTGTVYLQDSAHLQLHRMVVGSASNAVGRIVQTGGTVDRERNDTWQIGGGAAGDETAYGQYDLSGGTVDANQLQVGSYGTGVMNITGTGSLTGASWLVIGRQTGSTGTLNVADGGTLTHTGDSVIVGELGVGRLVVTNGGSVTMSSAGLLIGGDGGSNIGDGTVDLANGGLIVTPNVRPGGGPSTFNFDGGILRANSAAPTFMEGLSNAFVMAGGAVIDADVYDIAIGQDLADGGGGGGLLKLGTGMLTLNGNSDYTGATIVSNGTLAVNGSLTGGGLITVHDGATLGGTGSVGAVSIAAAATLAAGNSVGTMNFTDNVEILGTLAVENSGADADLIAITGSLTLGPASVLTLLGTLDGSSSYTIATFTGGLTGTFDDVSDATAQNYAVNYNVNDITLSVIPEPATIGLMAAAMLAVLLSRRPRR